MEGLGINGQLFIAQLLNFGIIFVLLVWLLKKPLARILAERSDKIEQSLKEAEQIKAELAKIESTKTALVTEAKRRSEEMVQKGQEVAAAIEKKANTEAKVQAEAILERTKAEVTAQKEQLLGQLEGEIKTLVTQSITKTLSELSADEQQKLVEASITELKKSKSNPDGR